MTDVRDDVIDFVAQAVSLGLATPAEDLRAVLRDSSELSTFVEDPQQQALVVHAGENGLHVALETERDGPAMYFIRHKGHAFTADRPMGSQLQFVSGTGGVLQVRCPRGRGAHDVCPQAMHALLQGAFNPAVRSLAYVSQEGHDHKR